MSCAARILPALLLLAAPQAGAAVFRAAPLPPSAIGVPAAPLAGALNAPLLSAPSLAGPAHGLMGLAAAAPALQSPLLSGAAASAAAGRFFDGAPRAAANAVAVPVARAAAAPLGRRAAPPGTDAFIRRLLAVLARTGGDPEKAEAALIAVLAEAHTAGQLEPVLQGLLADPRVLRHLPPIPEAKRPLYAAQLAAMIGAELEGAGATPGSTPFEPWEDMGRRQMGLVYGGAFAPRGPGEPSLFSEPLFVREFEALTGAPLSAGNRAVPLIDGPASFAARFALMRDASRSISIHSWAFYDDETGGAAADLLIEKKRQGLDVKVMVDGKTVAAHGQQVLARMMAAGVEVVFFQDPRRRYDGLHTKILLVDGVSAIAGGMNFGNEYSHMGQGQKWRDTDMLFSGPVVAEASRFMAALWNSQVAAQALPYGPMAAEGASPAVPGGSRMSFLADGPEGDSTIMLAYLKAIAGASSVINIENAYLITVPGLRSALLDALRRGVRVNILTNSAESVDEPIVTAPILASLPELVEAGAKVYLKRGDTLHSKFMTVDGTFSILGSFNLHPRSVRYEHELVVNTLDARVAAELDRAFAADLAKALPIEDPAALAVPDSPLTRVVRRYLFNQL